MLLCACCVASCREGLRTAPGRGASARVGTRLLVHINAKMVFVNYVKGHSILVCNMSAPFALQRAPPPLVVITRGAGLGPPEKLACQFSFQNRFQSVGFNLLLTIPCKFAISYSCHSAKQAGLVLKFALLSGS